MIVVDSSVWIDYFAGAINPETERLERLIGTQPVAAGDLILTEVLQGFRAERDYQVAKALFEHVTLFEMLGVDMAIQSAGNFRALRKRGITIRKTADVIIATFCIDKRLPLLFRDKDFMPFVEHLGLEQAS